MMSGNTETGVTMTVCVHETPSLGMRNEAMMAWDAHLSHEDACDVAAPVVHFVLHNLSVRRQRLGHVGLVLDGAGEDHEGDAPLREDAAATLLQVVQQRRFFGMHAPE